jgi:hypothetical protein
MWSCVKNQMCSRWNGSFGSRYNHILRDPIIDGCWLWMDNPLQRRSMEHHWLFVLYIQLVKCDSVTVIHNECITSCDWQKRNRHSYCPNLEMGGDRMWMIFDFVSWGSSVAIDWKHPWMKYGWLSNDQIIWTGSLPNCENERQPSVNNFCSCIFTNLTCNWFPSSMHEVLGSFIGKNNRDILPALSRK